MRTLILSVAAITCFGSILFAQSSQPSSSSQNSQDTKVDSQSAIVDPILTPEQINKLPSIKVKPQLTLHRALKIAERYAQKERFNLSSYFLLEARMVQYGSEQNAKELRWFFRWVNETGAMGDYIEITVSMKGKATRLPSM